ncbi:MAG: hypothetical protein M3389_14650 [Actinomycetota bacterium]|nr:hypothetical protein [Actinomycetota bacterium]
MIELVLFLHVLAAFMLMATVVLSGAVVLGAAAPERTVRLANVLWDVGGIGTLVFGVWLALDLDAYSLLDGWILAALVLWAAATELGRRARAELRPWHWLRAVVVVLLLADMVWKPGA